MNAQEALTRLIEGNRRYVTNGAYGGDVSPAAREATMNGQHPFAVVICCSDSRMIPEAAFSCGIGDIFVIRVAGNVVGKHVLGSVQYAVEHLGCELVVVLGHTNCGAVGATIAGGANGYSSYLTDFISAAIKLETDTRHAARLNALTGAAIVTSELADHHLTARAALYDIETGEVSWL